MSLPLLFVPFFVVVGGCCFNSLDNNTDFVSVLKSSFVFAVKPVEASLFLVVQYLKFSIFICGTDLFMYPPVDDG